MKKYYYGILLLAVFVAGCQKDDDQTQAPVVENMISFYLKYNVDGQPVTRDSIRYYNDAGNHYSIYNLLYYLSEIKLLKSDGSTVQLKAVHYVDCFDPATNQFNFKNVPAGDYTGISFNIGIDSAHNDHSMLSNSIQNINMEWPDMMGGGYHFLRLEGYFTDAGNNYGYAMHIGTNDCLVPISLAHGFTVTANSVTVLNLHMNVNEWYRNPNIFDFNTDGNYIMGDLPLMMKITENGHDVFTF